MPMNPSLAEPTASGISAWLEAFMRRDSSGGMLLVLAAALAMVLVNSPLAGLYQLLLDTPVEVRIGALRIAKPLLLWINDGLMALFFLLVGLEVKREMLEGELSRLEQILLPGVGAIGGMAVPAAIYGALNWHDPIALNGWAIPAATDIAFALGVLALLGKRVPTSLRVFLMALAIFDDLGAVVIIAMFYTADLSFTALAIAGGAVLVLLILNLLGVTRLSAYMLVGLVLWVSLLKSGVHATLAGVVLGFAIPLRDPRNPDRSPLHRVEEGLHQWIAFGILPLFAFANAGVSLAGVTLTTLLQPVPLGIAAGLFLGKQLGIFLSCGLLIRLGWARLPAGASWTGFYGVALLCGLGFTMSLFITSLAFEIGGPGSPVVGDRLGILLGSGLSALGGYLVLRLGEPRHQP
jgi:NhaA family Na+:H+ antiporter